jgi:hypothetical protein
MHSAMDGVLDLAQSIVLVRSPAIDVALGCIGDAERTIRPNLS